MSETPTEDCAVALAGYIRAARGAQAAWQARSTRQRVRLIGALRHALAADADGVVAAVGERFDRGPSETLTAEVIPLADAARLIARQGEAILAPRRFAAAGRPAWLWGVTGETRRVAHGVVAIIAPGNYRLLLAGVQIAQALAAGNAVVVKPAPGASAPILWLREALIAAGLPEALFQVLDETHAAGRALAAADVDKLVLTGSAATGRAVAARLAERGVPATLELSGNDAVFVLASADIALAARAIVWGMSINGGATCIAPRRIIVARACYGALAAALAAELARATPRTVAATPHATACEQVAAAMGNGWQLLGRAPQMSDARMAPCILSRDSVAEPPLPGDLFAPVAAMTVFDDVEAALLNEQNSIYALGSAVFGADAAARALARRLPAGVVTVNDLIAPTADPRAPFAGARASGYGVTRGAEGLRAMTRPQTVLTRAGKRRPHLATPGAQDADLFKAYLTMAHGRGLRRRLAGLRAAIAAARGR